MLTSSIVFGLLEVLIKEIVQIKFTFTWGAQLIQKLDEQYNTSIYCPLVNE